MNEILKSFPNPADYISHSIFLLRLFFFLQDNLVNCHKWFSLAYQSLFHKVGQNMLFMTVKFTCSVLWINLSGVKGLLRVRFGKTETHLHCNTVSLLTSLTFPENFSIIFSASDARRRFWKLNRHRSLKLQIRYAPLF